MSIKILLQILLISLLFVSLVDSDETKPAQTLGSPEEPDETKLRPGQYSWDPERATTGPAVILVSLPDQLAYVYRNGILIGRTSVSTGRPGYSTPTGVFHILQKQHEHVSDIYDASMPNMERLTWTGVALHAGGLPGYPSSHGCVHLPLQFSSLLYNVTTVGTTVIITDSHFELDLVEDPRLLASIAEKPESQVAPPSIETDLLWQPQLSPSGPISILISSVDKAIYIYRNGIMIGKSTVEIENPKQPLGYHVFTMLEGFEQGKSLFAPDKTAHRWMVTTIASSPANIPYASLAQRVKTPQSFGENVYAILEPGAIIVAVDEPATAETTSEPDFRILTNNSPTKEK
jgi:hypothetical protein